MSEPTARELLDGVRGDYPHEGLLPAFAQILVPAFAQILAARVEKVLALPRQAHPLLGYDACLDDVWRILNGEQP